MIPNTTALEEYLKPLMFALEDNTVSEILINKPHFVFIERKSFFEQNEVSELDMRHLMGLANLVARYSDQRLSEKEPLLSGQLPSGHRIQIALPPATLPDRVIISIRKQTIANISLDDYVALEAFRNTKPCYLTSHRSTETVDETEKPLQELFAQNEFIDFLKLALASKKNILIAGATSTGKTTFLNACLKEIPIHEHLITIEDVPEVKPPHVLHTPLFTSKGLQGVANVTTQDLVQASLRLRPDRIILGELRGAEAADFINATATGHDGSISSIHAANPHAAFMRLVHMVKLSGTNLTREDILDDLHTVIDIVVQLRRRIDGKRYYREVSEIYYANASRAQE
jgi:type IV secretion system protein VirB11